MEKYINMFLNKIKKMKKKHIIIVIICVIIIVSLILTINIIKEKKYVEEVRNKEYSSSNDFKTAKEYIIHSGSEYIKEEESKEENIQTDIYLKFKVAPFEGEESNEDFYNSLIRVVARTLNYNNYRLIDKDKNLIVTVIGDKENRTVKNIYFNGVENYFSIENSKKSIKEYKDIEEKEYEVNSNILNTCIKNNWEISKVKLGTREYVENDYLVYNNFMVRNITNKIYNIVFLKDYQEAIINGIKVGTEQDEIKKVLGEPDYDELGIIGYKGKDVYVFFGENTVSVYRVEKETVSEEVLNLMEEFRQNRSSKRFIAKLTELWTDFNDYEVEDDYINVEYALKGVRIQFNVTNEHGIILYQNYTGDIEKGINISDLKDKEDYEIPKYTYIHSDEDLVFEAEKSRAFKFEEIGS